MSEWKKVKLGELCDITSSKRCLASERSNNGIPFYCSKEIILLEKGEEIRDSDYIPVELYLSIKEKYGVPITGDLLLTTRGTNGIPYIYKKHDCFYFADGNLSWFKNFKSDLDVKYLYYWFKSDTGKHIIDSIAKGTAQKAIPIDGLRNINISIPSIRVQCKISEILSHYDTLIENYQKQIKLLEESAQRLYKEWFVDLRFPGYENTKIVDGVPEGWEKKCLGELVCFKRGKTITKKEIIEGNIPVVAGGTEPAYYCNKSNTRNRVITISASGANAGYTRMYFEEIWASDCSFIDCSMTNYFHFIYCYLIANKIAIDNLQKGAAQPHVYPKDINALTLCCPHNDILDSFESKISYYFDLISSLQIQIHKLIEARDRLLPKLMSGEIEV
ncbi:MAG TPA: restriction endonuclease subunit S [Bacteroidetes bacterium]|nr:restriction endonuclease subunit S [Candidatus Limimorpha avicola]